MPAKAPQPVAIGSDVSGHDALLTNPFKIRCLGLRSKVATCLGSAPGPERVGAETCNEPDNTPFAISSPFARLLTPGHHAPPAGTMKTRTRASLRSTAGSASTVVGAKSVAKSAAGAAAQAAAEPKPSLSRARTRSRAHSRAYMYSRDRSRGRSPSAAQPEPEAEFEAEPEAGRRSSSRDRSSDRSRPSGEREPADPTADEAAAVSQPTEPSQQPRHEAQGVSPYRLRSPRFIGTIPDYPGCTPGRL